MNVSMASATLNQVQAIFSLFGVPLQTSLCYKHYACLAYRVNILFKYPWGLRNIQRQYSFHNFKCSYNAELLNQYLIQ